MKRFIIAVILTIAMMLPLSAFGAGSCTQTQDKLSDGFVVVKLICTGDSADGSIPKQSIYNETIAANTGAIYLYQVKAYPTVGGTAPDAADVTVNMDNMDLLGGKGANLIHATATYDTLPYSTFMSAYRYPAITHGVNVAVANQSTASANFTLEIVFVK